MVSLSISDGMDGDVEIELDCVFLPDLYGCTM